jgi:SAM-dependent methyltransferase
MADRIHRSEGRNLFGLDPQGYDASRPDYPDWIFEELSTSRALFEGAATVEIGPGTGLATRRLIEFGASPITLIEPDERFAHMLSLATANGRGTFTVLHESFEQAPLADGEFDLAVAATAFHWIEQEYGLRKLRRILRNGGTAALIWNVFQDLDKEDPFHDATRQILAPLSVSPSGAPDSIPFALDRTAREADAQQAGFSSVTYSESRWSLVLDTEQVAKLYEGFSHIQRLDNAARSTVIDGIRKIAADEFGGRVERNMTSCLYRLS